MFHLAMAAAVAVVLTAGTVATGGNTLYEQRQQLEAEQKKTVNPYEPGGI